MKKYELKKQWDKELNRVKRLIEKAKKQGIKFEFDPIPKEPKKITQQSVNRLKKISIDTIKKHRKINEQESQKEQSKLHAKAHKDTPKKPRTKNRDDSFELTPHKVKQVSKEKQRKEKVHKPLTKEQLSERAKKAAQTRKENEQATPELAEQRRKQRAENLRRTREKMKQREATDPLYAEEQAKKRSERAKKAAQTRKEKEQADPELAEQRRKQRAENLRKAREKMKERKAKDPMQADEPQETDLPDGEYEVKDGKIKKKSEKEEQADTREEEQTEDTNEEGEKLLGVDAITGEIVTDKNVDDKRNYGVTMPEQSVKSELNEGANLIDTIREELSHAINQQVADLITEALDDVIAYHELEGDFNEWYESMNNAPSNIIDAVYTIKDDSDGPNIRSNAVAILTVIYGGWGDVPNSTKEQLEFLTSEYYYPTQRWKKQSAHRNRRKAYLSNQ